MHLNFVRHFLRRHLPLMLEKSLINCHCEGLDSIVFDETPEAMIRMFVAHKNNELWKNDLRFGDITSTFMSVAIHPHHCDLELRTIKGLFLNFRAEAPPYWRTIKHPRQSIHLQKFNFCSKIKTGKSGFEKVQDSVNLALDWETVEVGQSTIMKAETLHTVCVPKGKEAAWLVFEGKEDPNYKPVCYSNIDLTKFNDKNLYKPMNKDYLYEVLEKVYPQL